MLAVVAGLGVLAVPQAFANTFTVNLSGDDSDGICDAISCTLREAITAANANAGGDQIVFDLPPVATTIAPNSALPALAGPLTIDGTTQPGYASGLRVVVDGSSAGLGNNGFDVNSVGNVIKGLVINGFSNRNVWIRAPGNALTASFIGTNASGTTAVGTPAFASVTVQGGSGNTIGGPTAADGNVIAGRLSIFGAAATATVVRNNKIGVDVTGTVALGTAALDVDQAPGTAVLDNVVASIEVQNASGTNILRNMIGTNSAGTAALAAAPAANGIQLLKAPSTTIGESGGDGNVISGKSGDGISIQDSTGVLVIGNRIGTSEDGVTSIPNTSDGILVTAIDTPSTATIGRIADGDGNTIAHNGGAGIAVLASGPTGIEIRGNAIYGNGGLGIDLGSNGSTPNDAGDLDGGPNGLQNFPVLANAVQDGSGTVAVDFTLSTKLSSPTVNFSFDLYAGPSCGARTWVGTAELAIGVLGTLSGRLPYTSTVGAPDFLSATVTGPEGTSELSPCTPISGSFSVNNPQVSPFSVTTTADHAPDGCTFAECTLREAILAANPSFLSQSIIIPNNVTGTLDVALSGLGSLPIMDNDVLLDGNDAFRIEGGGTVSVGLAGANLVRDMIVTGFVTGIRDVDNIESNIIGTDALSTPGLGNGTGVELLTRNAGIVDNTISGNGVGLKLASGFYVQGNRIGIAHIGNGALGNTGNGIEISAPFGVIVQQGNIIAHNGGAGVAVLNGSTDNQITGNSIYGNVGLGIDLGNDGSGNGGTTPTDPGPPERANGGQNAAVLSSAAVSGTHTTVQGSLKLPAGAVGGFRIEAYAGPAGAPPQAQRFLGSINQSSGPGAGVWAFDSNQVPTALSAALPGEIVTITVAVASGTSEFSNTVVPTGVASTFVVDSTGDEGDETTGDGICKIDGTVCTLRAAIQEINASPTGGTIEFAIPADGTQTITLNFGLPAITKPVVIDGTTQRAFQEGAVGSPSPPPPGDLGIVLDGSTGSIDGLVLEAGSDGSTIRGLSLVNFEYVGPGAGDSAAIILGSNDDLVVGNYIGVGADGATIGRNGHGIRILGQGNTIGGVTALDRNVVSGNREGIPFYGPGGSNTTIEGNYIGVEADGVSPAPNDNSIVALNAEGADGMSIGGAAPGAGNVFHSLYASIQIGGSLFDPLANLTIASNRFGVSAGGGDLPDAGETAVRVVGATQADITDNLIEHARDGVALTDVSQATISGNTITDNSEAGVRIDGVSSGNTISQNAIDRNGELGIDLANRGVTSNDAFPDSPPQNAPVLSSVAYANGDATADYNVPGAGPNDIFTIEFFASSSADVSGHGEGLRPVGTVTSPQGGTGTGVVLSGVAPSEVVTATATNASGDTSEFSLASGLSQIAIEPEADAMLSSGFPGNNYGSDATADVYGGLTLSCSAAGELVEPAYTVMRFDLGAVPAGATITSARLSTVTRTGYAQNGDPAHWALALDDDGWDESAVTWNDPPTDFVATSDKSPRTSARNLGGAAVFRDNCDEDNPGDQEAVFPGYGYPQAKTVAAATTDFVATVTTAVANPTDGKLSLELWTPNEPAAGDTAYWARYYTRDNVDPALRPKLIVTYTAGGGSGSIDLTTSTPNVDAAASEVPLDVVPPSAFLRKQSTEASPVGSIPVGSIPVGSIPVGSIPVGSIPVGSIGFDQVAGDLLDVPLSTIPLVPPKDWDAVLAGTPLAGRPLQNISLGEVLQDATAKTKVNSLPVGSINLRRSALGSLPVASIGLGTTPVGSIPVGSIPVGSIPVGSIPVGSIPVGSIGPPGTTPAENLRNWCVWLSQPPISCPAGSDGSSLAGQSILSLALQGAPVGSIPVGSIPVGSIRAGSTPVGSIDIDSIPVGSIPVASIDVRDSPVGSIPVGSIPVGSIPVGSIPVGSIPVGSIDLLNSPVGSIPVGSIPAPAELLSCGVACPAGTLYENRALIKPSATLYDLLKALGPNAPYTLGDLFPYISAAGLGNLTIADLVASLDPDDPAALVTVADILALLLDQESIGYEQLDLADTNVARLAPAPASGDARYTAQFALAGATSASVEITLPDGFAIADGPKQLEHRTGPSTWVPDGQVVPTVSGRKVTIATTGLIAGDDYRIVLDARPGVALGVTEATATIKPLGAGATPAPNSAVVRVGENFEPNNRPDDSKTATLAASSFFLSHLSGAGDVDYFTFPAPAVAGTRVTFNLSHLPADYDLVVYGPAGQVIRSANAGIPIDGNPLTDEGTTLSHLTDPLAAQTIDDVVLLDQPVVGTSTQRGKEDDTVIAIADGTPGDYIVQVTGFNGAADPEPYMLRVDTQAGPPAPGCTPRSFPNAAGTVPTLDLTALPAGLTTVFVVNGQQFQRAYGAAATTAIADLEIRAARLTTELGIPSAVLRVDGDAAVRAAVATWNGCPTDFANANNVVRTIGDVLDSVRVARPTLRNVVLVGNDTVVPFARTSDRTSVSNEDGYASTFDKDTDIASAMRASQMLTDDPYGDVDPIRFLDRQLFIPDLAVGRLVESPSDIVGAVDRFLAYDGRLDTSTALVSGYDFLADGADAVVDELAPFSFGPSLTTLIDGPKTLGDEWTRDDFANALVPLGAAAPGLTAMNGHADHYQLQPSKSLPGTGLFSVGDLDRPGPAGTSLAQRFDKRLIFSMGCHSGLSVSDVVVPGALATDWAQSFASRGGTYIGNTGFGYGDSVVVAYTEELQRLFTANLASGLTVGQALSLAKQDYFGGLGVVGVYDEKASAEMTLYGLPMWTTTAGPSPNGVGSGGFSTLSTSAAPAARLATPAATGITTLAVPTSSSVITDAATGLEARELTNDWTLPLPTSVPGGEYYTGQDGVQVTHFRPIQPKAVLSLDPISPTAPFHGALITALESTTIPEFDPYYARPIVDQTSLEPEIPFDDLIFPSKLQSVTTTKVGLQRKQRLVLITGQFSGDGINGSETGTQRLFTKTTARAFSSSSTDFDAPGFSRITADAVGNDGVSFAIETADRAPNGAADVVRVLVALNDGGSVWKFVDLARTTGDRWVGSLSGVGTDFQYFVQSVDRNGNVAVSTNKGRFYRDLAPVAPPTSGGNAPLALAVPPPSGAAGFYNAPVPVTISLDGAPPAAGDGVTVSIDGGAPAPAPAGGIVQVTGDGPHTVVALAPDGRTASVAFSIDKTPPVTQITSGPSGLTASKSATLAFGTSPSEPSTFECSLDGGNFAPCTSPQVYGGLAEGAHTFTVRATDAAGNTDPTPPSRSWTVDTVAPVVAIVSAAPPVVNAAASGSTVTWSAGEAGAFKVLVGGSDCSGAAGAGLSGSYTPSGTVASLVPSASLVEGANTVRVCVTDAAGNVGSSTIVVNRDATTPDTTIATNPLNPTNSTSATFTYTSTEPTGGSFQCKLDAGTYTSCLVGGITYTGLSSGPHTFSVRATDAAGNVDPSPAVFTWTIVGAAPPPCTGPAPPGAILGGNGNDTLEGTAGNDVIVDTGGNNKIDGKGGNDTICSGSGNDTIIGGGGDDTIVDAGGNNTVDGGLGSDRITTGTGNDKIAAGDGGDVVTDTGGNNTVDAGGGVDAVTTGSGNDVVDGGAQDDTINVGNGNNTVNAGSGNDRITTGTGNDKIAAGDGDDVVTDTGGNNTVDVGSGSDSVTTGGGNDVIDGGSQNDTINAGNGNNTVNAGSGDDRITTGSGNDTIDGGSGYDICTPGSGSNKVKNCEG